jgi:hypothetical protein
MAFLSANGAVFLTAHQVFGDPFVLIVLGWLAGLLLAVPRVARAEGFVGARASSRVERPQTGSQPRPAVA